MQNGRFGKKRKFFFLDGSHERKLWLSVDELNKHGIVEIIITVIKWNIIKHYETIRVVVGIYETQNASGIATARVFAQICGQRTVVGRVAGINIAKSIQINYIRNKIDHV